MSDYPHAAGDMSILKATVDVSAVKDPSCILCETAIRRTYGASVFTTRLVSSPFVYLAAFAEASKTANQLGRGVRKRVLYTSTLSLFTLMVSP